MRSLAVSLALAAGYALTLGQHAMPEGSESNGYDALLEAARRYEIALMIDLPERLVEVPAADLDAASWLAVTAAANDRDNIEVGGTYVLIRPDRPPGSPIQGDVAEVLGILNKLGDLQFAELLAGTLTLGDFAASDRATLLRNVLNWDGTYSRARGDKEEEVLAMHARTGVDSLISLSLGAKYSVTIAEGRGYTTYDGMAMLNEISSVSGVAIKKTVEDQVAVERATTGLPLDFGSGKVMSIAELLRSANSALASRYRIDGRVLDNTVFVSGSYDAETFDAAVEVLLKVRQLQNAPENEEVLEAAGEQFLNRVKALVDDDAIIEKETVSLTELGARDEHTARRIAERFGLSGNHEVRVSQGFMLTLRAGDSIPIRIHQTVFDGKPQTVTESIHSDLSIKF